MGACKAQSTCNLYSNKFQKFIKGSPLILINYSNEIKLVSVSIKSSSSYQNEDLIFYIITQLQQTVAQTNALLMQELSFKSNKILQNP